MLAVAVGALCGSGNRVVVGVLGGGAAQIRVYGGGQIATPTIVPRTFSLDANANPDGLGAYGSFRFAGVLPGVRRDVTCLTLAGNSALVGGFIREGAADFIGRTSSSPSATTGLLAPAPIRRASPTCRPTR